MSKIKNIFDGWKNLLIEDEIMEPLYQQRLDTCNGCLNKKAGICILCGCVVKAKAHSPLESCPANYWKPILRSSETGALFIYKNELPENLQQYFPLDYIKYDDWKEFLEKAEKELPDGNS